ncbi:unnamed protein product [Brassica rapa subsp. narinosa]
MFIVKVEHTAAYRIIRFQATLMLATTFLDHDYQNFVFISLNFVFISLDHHDCAIYNTSAALKLSDYFRMIYNSLDEDEMLRKLRKFAR